MKFLLIIISLLLCGLIFYQLKYYPLSDDELPAGTSNSEAQGIDYDLNELDSIDAYEEIIKRPLFTPDRSASKAQSQVLNASVNVDELEKLIIFGVVKSGAVGYAIIGNIDGDKEARQVKVGFNYKGWRISEITEKSVKFAGDGLEYELSITASESSGGSVIKQTNESGSAGNASNSGERKTIRIPRSNQLGNQEPLSEKRIRELKEQKGYTFDLDEAFDDDYYDD